MSAKANTHIKLKRLVQSSILSLIWASIATVVAIVFNRSAQFGGSTSGLPVGKDFLDGMGTALSPPLVWIVAQALLTLAGVESDEPQEHMGSHGSNALWRHHIYRRAW